MCNEIEYAMIQDMLQKAAKQKMQKKAEKPLEIPVSS